MDRQVAISISFRVRRRRMSIVLDVTPCKAAFNKFIDLVGSIRALFDAQRGASNVILQTNNVAATRNINPSLATDKYVPRWIGNISL